MIRPGEFPFPITDGPEESRYLTWIRNHSNYMAVRGLLDYVRAISVLLRGILINFLIFLPFLLLLAVWVAVSYFIQQPPPYIFTKALLALFAIWILIFPIATPFFRIVRFKKTRATGSDSSVQQRDKYERVFGSFLISIIGVAAVESLPGLLNLFHTRVSWPTMASTAAGVTALFSIAPRLISAVGEGLAKKIAIFAVGALALVVPLIVVFSVSGFLVFGVPTDWTFWTALAGLIFPVLTICAVVIGILVGAFRRGDTAGVLQLVIASIGLVVLVTLADFYVFDRYIDYDDEFRDAAFVTLQQDTSAHAPAAALVRAKPGENLEQFSQYMNEVLEPLPEIERTPELQELAETAQQAGLYPEFAEVERLIAMREESCNSVDEQADDCLELEKEKRQLRSSARALSGAFKTVTPEELAAYLLSLSKGTVDSLRNAKTSYPYLLNAFELSWDSTAAECRPTVPDDGVPTVEETPPFCEIQDTFANTGDWFQIIQRDLAATASISLLGFNFYDTDEARAVRANSFWPKVIFVLLLALEVWFFCWLTVDVNLTSIHGLYRDRLASAFLIGKDTRGDIDIEQDINLMEICQHEAGSTAPYHLINTALNLQGSKDIGIRDRKSDFFIFSKKFIGGRRTGYCRSEHMEEVFPQMDLATAMAISAAAASPNMGRSTSPALVAIMTLLNIRLGFWIPNPGALEKWLIAKKGKQEVESSSTKTIEFDQVFVEELSEIESRWRNLYKASERKLAAGKKSSLLAHPTPAHKLAGIGYSGGGIRSATVNLGITQALERAGVFDHMDYMSTVSGGGYLGSSISTLMRKRGKGDRETSEASENADAVSEIAELVQNSVGQIFGWRIRPAALLHEALGSVNETSRWVNVSDGGHIENLAAIELLRRRCRYIIIGDGEADPEHAFNGLATLIRTARIDLGIEIKLNVDRLRLGADGYCDAHWAIGRIDYPQEQDSGYLLYVKSSVTGDEDESIRQYRHVNPSFPHESTADQFFSEGQFEAYRSLGQHIGEDVLRAGGIAVGHDSRKMTFAEFETWIEALDQQAVVSRTELEPA